jgi:hypothetical protein
MDRLKKSALPFLILFLLLGLAIGFRSFLMAYIIEPVALLFWAVWRLVSSVDQNIYWMALIVLCIFLFLSLIPSENARPADSAYNDTRKSLDRIEYWQAAINQASMGEKERQHLRDSLKELLIASTAQLERQALLQIQEQNNVEMTPFSPAARRYLFPAGEKSGVFSTNIQTSLGRLLPGRLRKWTSKYIHTDTALMEEILTYMEADLEIKLNTQVGDQR